MTKKFKPLVYVVTDNYRTLAEALFTNAGYSICRNSEDAGLLCFTGGEDISPKLYGESPLPNVYPNLLRDRTETTMYSHYAGEKFMVGLCRGGQLLNVMNGGRLWQDVDRHAGGFHPITDLTTGDEWLVNSLHHQGIIPGKEADVIARCFRSTRKDSATNHWNEHYPEQNPDIEACFYEKTMSLCVQFHPEFPNNRQTTEYFHTLMDRYFDIQAEVA